jgi:thermostable 8-oxoguanine DNA glycosylase
MQLGTIFLDSTPVDIELPHPDCEVVTGVRWGSIAEFPSPAYWAYQVIARRIIGRQLTYKLGNTLREEVGACILGGHGIPAEVGLAAFRLLKENGVFSSGKMDETALFELLKAPLAVNGKSIRYRFARQKAMYLSSSLAQIDEESAPLDSGKNLRNWLVEFPGIGLKTASWIARNWLSADDVAILDIHILRAGVLAGFLDSKLSVARHYLVLEQQFLSFSERLGVRASELDSVMWLEMMSSPLTVRRTLDQSGAPLPASRRSRSLARAEQSHAHPGQVSLLV